MFNPSFQGGSFLDGLTLPRNGLIWTGPVDTIGESSITLSSGSTDDLLSASWEHPDTAVIQKLDAMMGRDVLFDSSGTPYDRFFAEWASVPNNYCMVFGPNGFAGYGLLQSRAVITRAFRALGNRLSVATVDQGASVTADGQQIRVN